MRTALLLLAINCLAFAADKPTLYLIGDSTVRNGSGIGDGGQWGWGEPFVGKFDAARIIVTNRALGGTSSRTFYRDRWLAVRDALVPGDYVIMQFGHNDGAPLDDKSRARGTIRGVGDEVQEIENPITGKHEVVRSFGWYLRQYVEEAKARGAIPIVCSLIPRMIWKDGKINRDSDNYAGWAKQVALSEHVPFLDLNELIASKYDVMGEEAVKPLFADPHTHTSRTGAEMNADVVAAALKALDRHPLAGYLQ